MKLRDKRTGEIGKLKESNCDEYEYLVVIDGNPQVYRYYHTLKEVTDNYEDYEEQKGSALDLIILTLTNFIENEPDEDKVDLEDCKEMLEKLKAWRRLKDAGFKFKEWKHTPLMETADGYKIHIEAYTDKMVAVMKDLDLLFFGGEE